jgi:hypothetical protein
MAVWQQDLRLGNPSTPLLSVEQSVPCYLYLKKCFHLAWIHGGVWKGDCKDPMSIFQTVICVLFVSE